MKLFIPCLLVLLVGALPARAQDPPEQPALPDLPPRELEIRGQLEVAFPSLDRQPLSGFNPPPRIPELAGRRPYVEPYKQKSSDLPPSPLRRPDPPDVTALGAGDPLAGDAEAAAGRYFSRLVRVRGGAPLGPSLGVYGLLDYRGTDGHAPYDGLPDLEAAGDALAGKAGFRTGTRGFTGGFEFAGFRDDFVMYAAQPGATGLILAPQPDRQARHFGGAAWARTNGLVGFSLDGRVGYGTTHLHTLTRTDPPPGTPVLDGGTEGPFDHKERRFSLDTRLEVPTPTGDLLADVRLDAAQLEGARYRDARLTQIEAGAGWRFRYAGQFDLTAGGRLVTFTRAADSSSRATYLAPLLNAEFYPDAALRVYLANRPGAVFNTLADLYRLNPYLADGPKLEPTVYTVQAEAGGTVYADAFQFGAFVGFDRSPNFQFFEHAELFEAGGYARGFSGVGYRPARIFRLGGDVSASLPGGLQAALRGTYRHGRLTSSNTVLPAAAEETRIPNFGPLLAQGMLSLPFDARRGLLQLVGTYESARYRDRAETRKIGDYFDLDVAATYQVTPSVGLVLRAENLSAGYLERWDHYVEPSFVVMGGLRLRW